MVIYLCIHFCKYMIMHTHTGRQAVAQLLNSSPAWGREQVDGIDLLGANQHILVESHSMGVVTDARNWSVRLEAVPAVAGVSANGLTQIVPSPGDTMDGGGLGPSPFV